jgi:hypothetical protein
VISSSPGADKSPLLETSLTIALRSNNSILTLSLSSLLNTY